MPIRHFQEKDAPALTKLYHAAVHITCKRDYTPEQLEAWSPAPIDPQQFIERVSDTRFVFVATDTLDCPIGFIELENSGHIDCFYCDPDHIGTGIGSELYDYVEALSRARLIPLLFVEASETAKAFFLKKGFTLKERRDFQRNGVWIHNYTMEKPLGGY